MAMKPQSRPRLIDPALAGDLRIVSRIMPLVSVAVLIVARRLLRTSSGVALFPTLVSMLTVVAVLAFTAATVYQVVIWLDSRGARRRAEATFLLCHLGLVIAAVLYFLTTKTGMRWIGQDHLSAKGASHYDTAMTIAAVIMALCAVIPAIMMEATIGQWQSAEAEDAVELRRTREMGVSGLSIALATSFLMVTCNVASEKNIRKDLSYFRTASPGSSTAKIVKTMSQPIKVLLFFPESNQVADEVDGYFRELARQTGKVSIEHLDRLLAAQTAAKYQVQKDGTIVIIRGEGKDEKSTKFDIDTDMERARRQTGKLRILDQTVNTELMKILREKRKAYLTVGHGEINDPDSLPEHLRGKLPDGRAQVIKNVLAQLNYELKNLGTMDGLATEIPQDATFVMVLGPKVAFDQAELDTLGRFLDRGGHLLIAMDPQGDFRLGPLEGKLGTGLGEVRPGQPARIGIVTDDKNFLPTRRNDSDKQLALTNQFSSHASTTSLSRGAANQGILLETSGALFDRDFTAAGEKPKRTYVVRTMSDAWLDYDGNFTLSGDEKRARYNVGAAVEGPKVKQDGGSDSDGFRAMVFSDQDLFSDHAVQTMSGDVFLETNGRSLPVDAIKWLGGEEDIAGIVNNEKDPEIKQTARQQAAWFTATTIVAPLLVLGFGLVVAAGARRRPMKKAAAKKAAAKKEAP